MGILVGGIVFQLIYGLKILNPVFIEWTMTGDAGQHFIGWHIFRSEPWTFPLGVIKSLQYPEGTSLVYTDSIPLLAISLKLFSSFLPPAFQYHGIWLLICYVLQGFFSALLMKRITTNPVIVLISLPFFILFPIIIGRSSQHEALSGHFLILASLHLYFQAYDETNKKRWMILLIASVLVHFYLFFMSFTLFMAYCLQHILETKGKHSIQILKYGVVSITATLVTMWAAGYFVIKVESAGGGYFGHFSMNMLAPFNPMPLNYLTFLRDFPLATSGQYEGFNYLGIGVLLLMLISAYEFPRHKEAFNKNRHLPLLLACILLFLLSLSNKITFANHVLVEIDLPDKIQHMLGAIRSSGRLFFPVSYTLILFSLAVLIRYNSATKAFFFLGMMLSLQIIDLYPIYWGVTLEKQTWSSPLKSTLWGKLLENTRHIVFVPAITDAEAYIPFALFAGYYNNTINVAYTARGDSRTHYKKNLLEDFKRGTLSKDSLYIIRDRSLYQKPPSDDFMFGELDGYGIIAKRCASDDLKPWQPQVKRSEANTVWIDRDQEKYTLKELIEKFSGVGYVIFLSVRDDAAGKIPRDFVNHLKKIGSDIDSLKLQGSYAAVITDGKMMVEKIDNSAKVAFEYTIGSYHANIISSGNHVGNDSIITINGTSLSPNKRGFNVIVLKLDDGSVKQYNYDTFLFPNPAAGCD